MAMAPDAHEFELPTVGPVSPRSMATLLRARAAEDGERQGRRHATHAARHVPGVLLLAEGDAAQRRADPDAGARPSSPRRAARPASSTAIRAAATDERAEAVEPPGAAGVEVMRRGRSRSICAAIRDGNGEGSNRSMVRTADRSARTPSHRPSAPVPIGVTAPMPVITTRAAHRPRLRQLADACAGSARRWPR